MVLTFFDAIYDYAQALYYLTTYYYTNMSLFQDRRADFCNTAHGLEHLLECQIKLFNKPQHPSFFFACTDNTHPTTPTQLNTTGAYCMMSAKYQHLTYYCLFPPNLQCCLFTLMMMAMSSRRPAQCLTSPGIVSCVFFSGLCCSLAVHDSVHD